ncbi:Aldo/keto reductase [Microstroma glucosiphilum]|uniref:Aldo/keto reductase n=1 Tax=Pseudomicrostroma glucosiphilum TaxID=1684307 RepID=A0A316TZS8_9BASI|nr:Aldo/keto reductase [Pseudomicrostroma glucosiphilum]PWN18597.1 Aldo/keto reductase [Pseudomicrostroma glucosiphilum]
MTKLNNGNLIPSVALGVYKAPNDNTTEQAVEWALDAGYRHIDGAARYANEEAVGKALKNWCAKSGVPREQVFVTSKLWDADHERAEDAIADSLKKLQLEYMDMYLIHSPGNMGEEARIKAWKGLEDAVDKGLIKNIGVSNFDVEELDHLMQHVRIKPAVNQIESHPFFQHEELREATISRGIHIQAYSPMAQGAALDRSEIKTIATKHGKTPAQILLRWGLQIGNIILPKSLTQHRIISNAQLFDFELDADDMELLNSLDEGMKMGKLGPAGTSQPASPNATKPNSRRSSGSGGLSGGALKMTSN